MEIKKLQEQNTLMVRMTTAVENLPTVMGEIYEEIGAYMGKKELEFVGAPYARYYNMDMSALDVEMGFPVARKDPGGGRLKSGLLPAGEYATTLHTGPYDNLEETYNKLMAYVKEQGIEVQQWMFEQYLNSPMEVKHENLQTQIFFPVI